MNFAPLTTRGHSPTTWTFTPHTQLQITHRLHSPSVTALTQLFSIISLHLFTIIQSHTHYISSGLSATHGRVLFSLATLQSVFPSFLSLFPCVPIPWIILSALPSGLSLPKDYSLPHPCYTCLLLSDPACIDHVSQ